MPDHTVWTFHAHSRAWTASLAGSLWKVHRQRKPLAGRCHNISIRQIYGRSFAGGMTPRGPSFTFFFPAPVMSCLFRKHRSLSLSFYVCRHPPFDERRAGHLLTHCPALYFSPGGRGGQGQWTQRLNLSEMYLQYTADWIKAQPGKYILKKKSSRGDRGNLLQSIRKGCTQSNGRQGS